MSAGPQGALSAIGNTPLVELVRVVPAGSARVWVKLEFANPTGSMKDRMALTAIEGAIRDRRLRPGETVVEYTAGTTGISLAFVCAALGFPLHIVFSDAFSDEKRRTMEAFGADAIDGYVPMGEEIWTQTSGEVDAFVHAVGTAHSIQGVASALRRHRSGVRIVAVEPSESPVLSGGRSGANRIEGIGIGFIPPLWEPDVVDAIELVSADHAYAMARRLAREEGLFAGASSGANVAAALRVAEQLGPDATVVTILCDSGLRYLSTDVHRQP